MDDNVLVKWTELINQRQIIETRVNESHKVRYIHKIFNSSYKLINKCILTDNIINFVGRCGERI